MGYINAHTGRVAITEPRLTGWLLGTFETRYSGIRHADTGPVAGGHRLFDDTRGANIHTRSLQNVSTDITTAVELIDNDNNWTAIEHAGNNNDMGLDVQWGLQAIFDYLDSTHNINSLDDNGHPIHAYVRYGANHIQRDNAAYDLTLNTLYFGQGVGNFSPLASIDVVAHEYGHGITDFQIGWPYTGERAAFHEGLSDIWGAILEERIRPSATWRIGEQVTLNHPYLRNLQNPNDPSAMQQIANTFQSAQYNAGDHYVRGGVFSHWFYLLANGGSGMNDIGNSYNVQGVGLALAEELIVEAVFNNYLDGTTTYPAIRTALIAAAQAISCVGSQLVISTTNAWHAVGVGNSHSMALTGPATLCTSDTYTLTNLPAGATVTGWSASPSGAVTLSGSGNSRTVTKVGNFNGGVTLTVTISTSCGNIKINKDIHIGTPIITPINYTYSANTYPLQQYFTTPNNEVNDLYAEVRGNVEVQGSTATHIEQIFATDPSSGWGTGGGDGLNGVLYPYFQFWGYDEIKIYRVTATNTCGSTVFEMGFYSWELGKLQYAVYPNPANETLTVSIGSEAERTAAPDKSSLPSFSAVLYDTQGRQLRQGESKDGAVLFHTQQLPEGTYFLHIHHNGQVEKRQVVIRH